MSKKEDGGLGKPSSSRASNAPKELYAYTPSWMTAAERSKLKARIRKIKKKEGLWGMRKEEDTLVQSTIEGRGSDPQGIPEERKDRDVAGSFNARRPEKDEFGNLSAIHPDDDGEWFVEGTPTSAGPERPDSTTSQHKFDKSGASERPKKKGTSSSHEKSINPKRSNRESLSRKKSKEELTMTKEKKGKPKHPKAVHANPSGNLVKNEKPRTPNSRNTLEDHLWVTDFEHFDPRLYSFKSPEKLSTKKPVVAECPPFWVLNDHTIAVAWKLYCKEADRGDLGIVALQWSREFVSAMKDERGEYPIAIKHLLDAIEDGLIYRYSRAAEDSKTAHQKSDDISYASSDSVFKPPTEVSYTLKDIMSRNFPGRQSGAVQPTSVIHKNDTTPVVHKTVVPVHDDPVMTPKDMVAFLQQMKIEQEVRVEHEKEMQREIEKLLKQVKDGKMPALQSERKEHVEFIVPPGHYDEANSIRSASSPLRDAKGKSAKGKDINKSASGISNKSAASDRTVRSSPSRVSFQDFSTVQDSGYVSQTDPSRDATSPDIIESSYTEEEKPQRPILPKFGGNEEKPNVGRSGKKESKEGAAKRQSKEGAAKRQSNEGAVKRQSSEGDAKRQSKETVGVKPSAESVGKKPSKESITKKGSKESVAKKGSKESVAKKGSKESVAKKGSKESVAKKGSKESVAKKGSKESQASQKSSKGKDTKPKKGSKVSKSGEKKLSQKSKGSKRGSR